MMLKEKLMRLFGDEVGATAIEYALIAALVSVVAIVAMTNVGSAITNTFATVANTL